MGTNGDETTYAASTSATYGIVSSPAVSVTTDNPGYARNQTVR